MMLARLERWAWDRLCGFNAEGAAGLSAKRKINTPLPTHLEFYNSLNVRVGCGLG
jgi:hypothetical protein